MRNFYAQQLIKVKEYEKNESDKMNKKSKTVSRPGIPRR